VAGDRAGSGKAADRDGEDRGRAGTARGVVGREVGGRGGERDRPPALVPNGGVLSDIGATTCSSATLTAGRS